MVILEPLEREGTTYPKEFFLLSRLACIDVDHGIYCREGEGQKASDPTQETRRVHKTFQLQSSSHAKKVRNNILDRAQINTS